MKIIEPGHKYLVHNVDGDGTQEIVFVRRRGDDAKLLEPHERHEGILGQELVRVLIDRVRYLNDEEPCIEDVEIIGKLRDVLRLFEGRAARKTLEKMPMPELEESCPICHHVLCPHRHPDRLQHSRRR